ncbi:hypothetical protein HO173_003309 [Letharia columbiana]|uniref:Uncharacterized protein n=1 Tax=Letharia columbiana TaxID=112416 RepID=A0A8H6G1N8_9LECA|nr:uncharacterized protein HO173_003309 [Letharia columbiana]KAF6238802.1 hypothetical protein HO173_003309 [Letharia columbiana]
MAIATGKISVAFPILRILGVVSIWKRRFLHFIIYSVFLLFYRSRSTPSASTSYHHQGPPKGKEKKDGIEYRSGLGGIPLLSGAGLTRRTKGYRRSGSTEDRIELGNLSRVYAVKRNGNAGFQRHTQPTNQGSIQRTIDVDVRLAQV